MQKKQPTHHISPSQPCSSKLSHNTENHHHHFKRLISSLYLATPPPPPPTPISLPPALTPSTQPFFQSQPKKQNKTATQFFHVTLCLAMMHHHHTKFGYKRLGGFRRCLLDKTRTHGQTDGQSARRTDNQPQTPSHKGRQPARTDRQPARRTDNQAQEQTPSRDNNNKNDFYSAHQQHKVGAQSALQQY